MKKMFFEGLQEYLVNKNIEVYEVLTCKDKEKAKYKLVPVSGNIKESSEIFYFNKSQKLFEFLYGNKLILEGEGPENLKDVFSGQPIQDAKDFFTKMCKIITGKTFPSLGEGGGHGIAFDMGKDVLKFTDDPLEAENGVKCLDKKLIRLANIYKIFVIKYFQPNQESKRHVYYAIEEEKILDVGKGFDKSDGYQNALLIEPIIPNVKTQKQIQQIGQTSNINDIINIDQTENQDIKKLKDEYLNISDKKDRRFRKAIIQILLEMGLHGLRGGDYTNKNNMGWKMYNDKKIMATFDLGGKNSLPENNPDFKEARPTSKGEEPTYNNKKIIYKDINTAI